MPDMPKKREERRKEMPRNERLIGSHIGFCAPDYFLGSVSEALSFGENALMLYTGSPQHSFRVPLERIKREEGKRRMEEAGIAREGLVVHATYLVNLAKIGDPEKLAFSREYALEEIRRAAYLGASSIVFHPGSHKGGDEAEGFETFVESVRFLLERTPEGIALCIETMAGRKNELGADFSFFQELFRRFPNEPRLGACIDTCHLNDSGFDLSDPDAAVEQLLRVFGTERIKVIHLNDSANPIGSRKDRHANLGYGTIGFDALRSFAWHPAWEDIPIILETPYVDGKPPYKKEIAMLRSGVYEENWKESLSISLPKE